jgi:F-box interacting protein
MAEFFPTDVLVEILLRLPSCARRRSRLVCQLWRDTVDTRTTTKIRPRTLVATKESVHLIEDLPSSSSDGSPTGSRDLWAGDAFKGMHLVGTCNGLVCMCDNRFRHRQKPGGSITLANPVTGEALAIPPLRHAKYSWCSYLMYGFGYHPATGRYKVVHVPYLSDRVSVFTLGEAAWRTVATGSPKETYDVNTGIVSVNGAAYWAVKEPAAKVVSFDLGNEHITYIRPLPDELSRPGCWRLTEVRGRLGIAFSQDDKTEVWVMEQCTWSRWYSVQMNKHQLTHPNFTYHGDHVLTMQWQPGRGLVLHKHKPSDGGNKTQRVVVEIDERNEGTVVAEFKTNYSSHQTFAYVETTEPLSVYQRKK